MLKKIWVIFMRDLKVSKRDFMTLYIILAPILFAIGINFLAPSINDTTVKLALIDGENTEMVEYFEDFAKVELLDDEDAVRKRIERRDDIIGILPEGSGYYILNQGNESEMVIEMSKVVKTFYDLDIKIENSNAEIIEFGKEIPPLKKVLTNLLIMLTSVLGGMLITFNIIEEKGDNTISAINVTPISRGGFIAGKSLIGLCLPVFGTIAILLITGFGDVNIAQIILITIAASLLSIIIGLIEGIKNDDVMNAAASVKALFIPLGGAVAGFELLGDKWQKFFYWLPFYWTYKGNDAVLSYTATWKQMTFYTIIVALLCGVVIAVLAPKVRKGLE